MQDDPIDRMRRAWAERDPGLATAPLEVAGRLLRLATHLERSIAEALRPLGLSYGDFDVLNTLRREGDDGWTTPTALARSVLISTGATTARLERLERAGLLTRVVDPDDRRGVRVSLTVEGRERATAAVHAVLAADERFLLPLDDASRDSLAGDLRRLLLATETA